MPVESFSNVLLTTALTELGHRLLKLTGPDAKVTLYVVGGSAAVLRRYLPRPTHDCDYASIEPVNLVDHVQDAAYDVALSLDLSSDPSWLNDQFAFWTDTLSPGWRGRSVTVLESGPLTVKALARIDFIAAKAFGINVEKHRQDFEGMTPAKAEIENAIANLAAFAAANPEDQDDISQRIGRLKEYLGAT